VTMDGESIPVDDKNKLRRFIRQHILRKPRPQQGLKKRARPKARPKRKRRKS